MFGRKEKNIIHDFLVVLVFSFNFYVLGWLCVGVYAFFFGLNFIFFNMFQILPLWTVVFTLALDVLLLFRKVGFGHGGGKD